MVVVHLERKVAQQGRDAIAISKCVTRRQVVCLEERTIGGARMLVGDILIGILAGLVAAVAALFLGASFWLAFGVYAVVGSAALVLLPITRMLAQDFADQGKAPTNRFRWNRQDSAVRIEPSVDQVAVATETSTRILAVDDDPFILELIPLISAKAGFSEVSVAASGQEALDLLMSSDTIFDCLLFDISMPDMDGIELCQRVRQIPHYRQTPIVMLTAIRDITKMGDAYRAGATNYATKPFDIEDLGTRLRMAREAILAQREPGYARQESSPYRHRKSIFDRSFELPDALRLRGMGSLVDHAALSNYLTQLSRKDIAAVQVFAVKIDGVDAVRARSSPHDFVVLIENLAAATAGCFGAERTVTAYAEDATLLVVASPPTDVPVISIEIDIEKRLKDHLSKDNSGEGYAVGISVGGPVQPQGTKTERARLTVDRVVDLAENRALNKQGRKIAGLFKR